ncbi:MAG TPA: putative phage tail protein [Kaistia sp.]|nr:putative phage tail protein [Kaistia sp.]
MSRSADVAHREILSLMPPGWVWPRGTDSLFAAVLKPLAIELADLEATAEAMIEEIDPRTATLCLEDFERVLGADPCGRDPLTYTIAERQQLAHQRWTARGGQSIAYFTELAAKRGIAINIIEAHPTVADRAEAGDELVESPEQFVWLVQLAATEEILFEAGKSEAGDLLVEYRGPDIECDIRRRRPAQTEVVFSYTLSSGDAGQLDFSSASQSGQELDGWL